MSFELKKRERVPEGIRRVVRGKIDAFLRIVRDKNTAPGDEAIHEARKQLKQARGALRLVRNELGKKTFQRENQPFREAGRPLSALRDAKVVVDTLDGLIGHFSMQIPANLFRRLRDLLLARRREVRRRVLERDHVRSKLRSSMKAARQRAGDWQLRHAGWKAMEGGLKRIYRRGRHSMRRAMRDGSDDSFHELRKRTKNLRYALELLVRARPEAIGPLVTQSHHLTDLLGDDHDLSVLQQVVQHECHDECGGACPGAQQILLLRVARRRRKALQKKAMALARRLYADTNRDFVDRIKHHWEAWSGE